MKNEQENESLEIELEVYPSFKLPLKITVEKCHITYQGYFKQGNSDFPQNASGKIPISSSDFNELVGDIKIGRISAFPKYSMGLDGTTFKISIKNGFNSAIYEWWAECPSEWAQLGKLAEKLIDYVKRNAIKQ